MYQPYPSSGQPPPEPADRPRPPRSVMVAVRFMYAGAVLQAIGLVIFLATVGSLRSNIHKAAPKLTPAELHSTEVFLVALTVVTALVGIGLWIWMAMMNRAGRNWARVLGTVFFGLQTLLLLLGLSRAGGAGSLFSILPWLIGLGAVIFLWRRDSTEFFKAASGR